MTTSIDTTGTDGLGPADSPGFLMWRATLRWQREVTTALAPFELTHVQFVLLMSLWWLNHNTGEAPNQLSLARQAGADVKMVSQVVGRLEERGLVERTTDPADTRAKLLRITRPGADLVGRARAAVESADAAFFAAAPDPTGLLPALRQLADFDRT